MKTKYTQGKMWVSKISERQSGVYRHTLDESGKAVSTTTIYKGAHETANLIAAAPESHDANLISLAVFAEIEELIQGEKSLNASCIEGIARVMKRKIKQSKKPQPKPEKQEKTKKRITPGRH